MQYVINTALVVISDRFVDTGKFCALANLPDLTPVGKPK